MRFCRYERGDFQIVLDIVQRVARAYKKIQWPHLKPHISKPVRACRSEML